MSNPIDIQNARAMLYAEGYTITEPSIVPERIEVRKIEDTDVSMLYHFWTTVPIPLNSLPAIKQAIENVLNEVQEDKPFVWTDSDLIDFAKYAKNYQSPRDVESALIKWKQSKQSPTNLQEPHKCKYCGTSNVLGDDEECYMNPKNAPEPQPSTTVKDKQEWEIVSFKRVSTNEVEWVKEGKDVYKNINSKCGGFSLHRLLGTNESDSVASVKTGQISINEVVRLSDNTVFSIGDSYDGGYKITAFKIDNGIMMYECNGNGCFYNIAGLRVPDSQKQFAPTPNTDTKYDNTGTIQRDTVNQTDTISSKPVLFTTEDGVGIRIGDRLFYVTKGFEIHDNPANRFSGSSPNYKYFSTKEAAEQYCNLNKPKYSLQDILNMASGYIPDSNLEFLKDKLMKQ